MSITEIAAVVTAAGTVLGGGGFFVARATVRAARVTTAAQEAIARIQTEPQAEAQRFAVLQATVNRLDEDNGQLRGLAGPVRFAARGFSRTVNRLIYRMERAGVPPEPEDIDELVREYMRTGA